MPPDLPTPHPPNPAASTWAISQVNEWLFALNLVPFLALAAERLILQKVGGGYRFVHRLLQDYLASLTPEDPPPLPKTD